MPAQQRTEDGLELGPLKFTLDRGALEVPYRTRVCVPECVRAIGDRLEFERLVESVDFPMEYVGVDLVRARPVPDHERHLPDGVINDPTGGGYLPYWVRLCTVRDIDSNHHLVLVHPLVKLAGNRRVEVLVGAVDTDVLLARAWPVRGSG